MRGLLVIRDRISRFYGTYDTVIRIAAKFLLALCVFLSVDEALGQAVILRNPLILGGCAFLCAFLPSNCMILVGAGMILVHFYAISLEALLAGGGMLLIGLLIYYSIAPHSAVPLLLTVLTMGLGIPAAPALLFGLIGGPLSAAGVIFGTVAYDVIETTGRMGGSLEASASDAAEAMVQKMTMLIDAVISNQEIFLTAAALAVLLWVVLLIRRMAIKYAWMLAAGAGLAVYLLIRVGGSLLLGLEIPLFSLGADVAAALLTAWFAQAFLFSLDYRRTENIRFEDDDYFYYVKAVPKKKVHRKKRARRAERRR